MGWFRRSIEANRNYSTAHFHLAAALALLGALAGGTLGHAGVVWRSIQLSSPQLQPLFRSSSDNPTYLAGRERVYEGMRIAGVPEG